MQYRIVTRLYAALCTGLRHTFSVPLGDCFPAFPTVSSQADNFHSSGFRLQRKRDVENLVSDFDFDRIERNMNRAQSREWLHCGHRHQFDWWFNEAPCNRYVEAIRIICNIRGIPSFSLFPIVNTGGFLVERGLVKSGNRAVRHLQQTIQ